MSQVIVVGAGVGGLAAAARLAAQGHAVTICERAPQVGGKLGRLEMGGFRFDTGPSLLTWPRVFTDLFAATGDPLERVLSLRPVEPRAHYRFADGTQLDAWGDVDAFRGELEARLAPGSGADWRRFLAHAERVWAATRGPFLTSPLAGARSLAGLALRRPSDLPAVTAHRTLRGVGAAYLRDPRLRQFLDRYATYTGSDPRRAPAALATVAYLEQAFGVWYVEGGLHQLAAALADRAVERGAAILTGHAVTAITTTGGRSGGRVSGVRLGDGGHLPADVVVSDADAAHLYGSLMSDPRTRRSERARARAVPSLAGFVLLLGLRGRPGTELGLGHHTVLFPADYDAEFDAVFGAPARPVADPTIYLSAPDDPATRPDDDSEAWFVLVNSPRHGTAAGAIDWTAPGLPDSYAAHLLDLLAARGLDVRDRVAVRQVLTPADLAASTGAVGGAIYGTSSNGMRAAFLRPANRSRVPGLFLVGGSAHPGGGLPLVAQSARIVADLVGPAE